MDGSHDGLAVSRNDGKGLDRELRDHEGVRHCLGSPGQDGYRLVGKK